MFMILLFQFASLEGEDNLIDVWVSAGMCTFSRCEYIFFFCKYWQ